MTQQQLNSDDHESIIDADYDDVSKLDFDNDDELATILEEIGSDTGDVVYTLNVYRIPPTGKKVWLYECDPTQPQKEKLRDEYGGGKFEFWLRRNNRIFARPKILIEAPKNNYKKNESQESNINKSEIIELIEESQKKMLDGFAKLIPPVVAQPVINPLTQMSDMLALMTQFREFTGSNKQAESDPFDNIKKVLELKKLFGSGGSGGGDGDTTNADVLIAAIEHIGGPLSEMTKRTALQKSTKPTAKTTMAAKPQAEVQKKNELQENEPMLGLKMGIKLLVSAAQRNDDPAPYVDIILSRLEPEQIRVFLTDENAMDLLSTIDKRVLQFPSWFEEISKLLNERLDADDADEAEEDEVSEAEAGNTG